MAARKYNRRRNGRNQGGPAGRTAGDDKPTAAGNRRRGPLFVKLDERWPDNIKLRQLTPKGLALYFGLVAWVGRHGLAGVVADADVIKLGEQLSPWFDMLELWELLAHLEAAGLVVEVDGGVELSGWNPDEWGAGWRRNGEAQPCTSCKGKRTAVPGMKTCQPCRDAERARWLRRREAVNAARRTGRCEAES